MTMAGSAKGERPSRPAHTHPTLLLLVFLGGACGTSLRAWIETHHGAASGTWPWATFWINLSGSLMLGLLLELLAGIGPDDGWRRRVRVGVGTGIIGGYTTYSTFAVETDLLIRGGSVMTGAGYAAASVAGGLACACAGVIVARWVARGIVARRRQGVDRA